MKNKRRLLILSIVLALVLGLAACTTAAGTFTFGEYKYTNPEITQRNWRDIEYGDNMTIDGSLDEAVWETLGASTVKDSDSDVELKTKLYFGESGLFIGMESNETDIFHREDAAIYNNTSVEIYITPTDSPSIQNINSVQLRYGVVGDTEQWIARVAKPSSDSYQWSKIYIQTMSRVKINGELNTKNCEGFSVEAFLAYKELGLSERPESLLVFTAFNRRLSLEGLNRNAWVGDGGIDDFSSYYYATHDGITGERPRGSGGFRTNDNGVTYHQFGGGDQFIPLNSDEGNSKYYFEAEVTAVSVLNNNPYPKFGLMAARTVDKDNTVNLFIDPTRALSNKIALQVERNEANKDWLWGDGNPQEINTISYTNGNYVKLAVLREGKDFYLFVNDALYMHRNNYGKITADTKTTFGFFTMEMEALYRNIKVVYGDDVDSNYDKLVTSNIPERVYTAKGHAPDISGFAITGINKSGSTLNFPLSTTAELRFNGEPISSLLELLDTAGEHTITVTHTSYDFINLEFVLRVMDEPDEITITTAPAAGRISVGLDFKDAKLNAKFGDEDIEFNILSDMITGFDRFKSGEQTVTVTFLGKSVTFKVTLEGTLGSSKDVKSTDGFDLTTDKGDNPTVTNTGVADQMLLFSELNATKYYFETEVKWNAAYNGDPNPKFGIIAAAKDTRNMTVMLVDSGMSGKTKPDNKWVLALNRINNGWKWPTAGFSAFGTDYTEDYVKLAAARDGSDIAFFVDDVFVGYFNTEGAVGANVATSAGFITMNIGATFRNYSFTTDSEAVDAKFAGVSGLPAISLDGDMSDWEANANWSSINANKVEMYNYDDTEKTGTGVTIWSFVDTTGIYIYYRAKHTKNITGRGNWWENVNAEMFAVELANNDARKQFWAIQGDRASDTLGYFNTSGVDGNYITVAELYIPFKYISNACRTSDYTRMTFAFKINGGGVSEEINFSPTHKDSYWCKHRVYVYADGIFDNIKA